MESSLERLVGEMTQVERWNVRYQEVMNFILENKRNPSKYADREKLLVHFLKRGRKMMNAGELKEPRLSKFMELLELCNVIGIRGRISTSS